MPWEAIGDFANTHGIAALVFLGALGAMGAAVYYMWKRHGEDIKKITELSEKLAGSGKGPDGAEVAAQHKEIINLLKVIRFAYSGDGEVMKKLNEILVIDEQLYEAHLGTGARDEEGRLKWWGAARMEELLTDIISRYEQRIEALQEVRLDEAKAAGTRIDELQEKRVEMSGEMLREMVEVMKDFKSLAKRIQEVMENLQAMMLRGGGNP